MSMDNPYDVFVSYRRNDSHRILPLADALRAEGVAVFLDPGEIGDFAPATEEAGEALANSKALLAWYSAEYPKSRSCQMELSAALLAAQREGDPGRRVWVINPEASATHIEPARLRDAAQPATPTDPAGYAALAKRVAAQVRALKGTLDVSLTPPPQYGLSLVPADRFLGRLPELWRLHSALSGAAGAVAQVTGMGGLGKSRLAQEYVLRFAAAYPGGIFWLRAPGGNADGPEQQQARRDEQFRSIAVALGLEVAAMATTQVETALADRLNRIGERFLWVVDELASGLGDAARAWLSPSPLGSTLLTTRSGEYAGIGEVVPLQAMAPGEACDLICAHGIPDLASGEQALRGLTGDVGGHPLTLDVSGAALKAHAGRRSIADYRTGLAQPTPDELKFAAEVAPLLPAGCERSVAAALTRSVGDMGEEGRDFLRLAGLLGNAPIPLHLVVAAFAAADNGNETRAGERAERGVTQAVGAALAESTEEAAVSVHTLVSRAARFRETDPERRARLRQAALGTLSELLPELADIGPHSELALDVLHARELCARGIDDADAATLAGWVARHDFEHGAHESARRLQEQAIEVRRRILGPEHPDTLTAMNNLALLLKTQGDVSGARGLQEQVLETSRRVLGAEHPDTLAVMNNLAGSLWALGELAGARSLQEQALDVSRRILGPEHPDTLTAMSNLAQSLTAEGDQTGARGLWEQVLEVSRRVLGPENPDTLTAMNNLAGSLWLQGDVAGARGLEEQAIEISGRVMGPEHPGTLAAMNNLAGSLWAQGDLAGTRSLLEQVLEISTRTYGPEYPDTLTAMSNLAQSLTAEGNQSGARGLWERLLEISTRTLGTEHPGTTVTAWNLYVNLGDAGENARADELFQANLAWLLEREPENLDTNQQHIRQRLTDLITLSREDTHP